MNTLPMLKSSPKARALHLVAIAFGEFRSGIDQRVLEVFGNKSLKRSLRETVKINFDDLWERTAKAMEQQEDLFRDSSLEQLQVHQSIVDGLPGEALYIAAAMAFDSLQEALPFFDVSAKTARLRVGGVLPANQGEIALRIGRVLSMAGDLFGSLETARQYLRTPNFALGGKVPRDLLKTGEGEQLVLAELQTQAAGGPV
jgi:putative toxin-antitoxin system antitoxin component (TIGR02293 family)